jgi:hypothetical protein
MAQDITFLPGLDQGGDTASGMGLMDPGAGINLPIAATTGSGTSAQTAQSSISGTSRNTPKKPPIFRINHYDFMLNAYFGTGGFKDGTILDKSQIELDDEFLERRATTHYRNFVPQIIDATYIPVFACGATRKTEVNGVLDEAGKLAPLWNAFLDNVDCRHRHIGTFMKKIARYARLLSVSFIVIDNFPLVSLFRTDALKNRTFPFAYMRLPQQVETAFLELDDFCQITKIAFRERPEKMKDPKTGQIIDDPRWKLWTKDYSVKLRKNDKGDWQEMKETQVTLGLDECPVIPVMPGEVEEDTILPHPQFYQVAKCNWSIYNLDSWQIRLVRSQMFPIPCLPKTSDANSNTIQAMGPLRGLWLPPNGGPNQETYPLPMYLAPPTGPYTELGNTVKDLREDIFRQAGQQGVEGVPTSGKAEAYRFQAKEWVLKESAKMVQNAEEAISRIFQQYVRSEQHDFTSLYEEDYHPEDPDSTVKLYGDYIALDPGVSGRALALEQVTRSVFNDLDDEEVQPVIDEIREKAKEDKKTQAEMPSDQELMMTPEEQQAAQLAQMQQPIPTMNLTPQKKVSKVPLKKGFTVAKGGV